MNEEAIEVLKDRIKQLSKPVYNGKAKKPVISQLQQAISQLKDTKIIASGKCKIWTHYDKTEEVYVEKDKHTRYFIDDIIKSKYNEQEIIIKIEVME